MSRFYGLDDFEYEGFDETLEDASGREYEIGQLVAGIANQEYDEILSMSNCSKFLLTGPTGYGKSYLAKCFSQTLKEEYDYKLYHIDCEDVMDEDDPEQTWQEIFREVLEKTHPESDDGEKMYLYLEHLDALKENRKCVKLVSASLKAIADADCTCIFLATAVDGSSIPVSILRQFTIMELGLPDENERREYFKSLLGFEIEDSSAEDFEEENTITFYPLDVTVEATKTEGNEEQNDELSILALYCAEKTEGLSFGQLEAVLNLLTRKLKKKLQEITDGDADAILSQVKMGKEYIVAEEEFLEIIGKVKKAGNLLVQAEIAAKSVGNGGTVSVANQPQVIYAAPMMMPGMQMAGAYGISGSGVPMNAEDNRMKLLSEVADSDNPEVSALLEATSMIPEDLDAYAQR